MLFYIMKYKGRIFIFMSVILCIIIISGIYWIIYLNIAHSSFDNYYNFRGCKELINKSDDYGFCKLASGETIKIVKFQNKWYLDGDLPVNCGFGISCP